MVWPALAPYVASLTAYDLDLGAPGVHIGMPSTALTLVLALNAPLDVGWAGRDGSRARLWGSVAGLHVEPAEIRHHGRQEGVMLGLTPRGARALLGVPASTLRGHIVDLDDLDEPAPGLCDLASRLSETPRAARETVASTVLTGVLARHDAPQARVEVGRALARLFRGAPVADVADEVGYSRRHLGDLVRAETGLSPKQYQRLSRFERSHALVAARVPLSAVAVRCGYADQSHLTREWVALAGVGPAEWRRRELPFVQDDAEPAAAASTA